MRRWPTPTRIPRSRAERSCPIRASRLYGRRSSRNGRVEPRRSPPTKDSLRAELRAVGVEVRTVYDLVDDTVTPLAAVPVLVRHLQLPHEVITLEGIVRALSYSHLRSQALEPLKVWFAGRRARVQRWIAANALASMADLDELDDLEGIHEFRDLFDHPSRKAADL